MFYVKEKCFCTKSVSNTASYILIHNVDNDQLTNFIDMDIQDFFHCIMGFDKKTRVFCPKYSKDVDFHKYKTIHVSICTLFCPWIPKQVQISKCQQNWFYERKCQYNNDKEYSSVTKRNAGPNKRAGWRISQN